MKLIIMNEGIDYDIKSKQDAVDAIFEEYHKFDDSMCDILASVELQGFSMEDVVDIYAECMLISDGDHMIRITEEVTPEIHTVMEKAMMLGLPLEKEKKFIILDMPDEIYMCEIYVEVDAHLTGKYIEDTIRLESKVKGWTIDKIIDELKGKRINLDDSADKEALEFYTIYSMEEDLS